MPRVVWGGESKTGLGVEIGPRQQNCQRSPNIHLMSNLVVTYFYPNEKHNLILSFTLKMPSLVRYIDDIHFLIILYGGDDGFTPEEWIQFGNMINDYGILKREVEEPSTSVNYLDLTASIENGALVTKTDQKSTSLHQYITYYQFCRPSLDDERHCAEYSYHLLLSNHLQGRLLESGNCILQKSKVHRMEQG